MNDLTFSASANLTQPTTPDAKTQVGSRVVKIILAKPDDAATVTSASDCPTAADFQTAITAGTCVVIDAITNGHREQGERTEFSGDDTETGGVEVTNRIDMVNGRIKRFDNTTRLGLEKLDRHNRLRLWYITDKNYCFGGTDGYDSGSVVDPLRQEGYGSQPYYPFEFSITVWGADDFKYDADYEDLSNA